MLISIAPVARTQDLPYDSGSTGADGALDFPSPIGNRSSHAAAFHEGLERLVVFSGSITVSNNTTYFNDTWVRETPNWSISNPTVSPPPRTSSAMAYDPVRQEIIMFGGGAGAVRSDDTWSYNGTTWTLKNPTSRPPARSSHAMVFDLERGEIVLYGGFDGTTRFSDTWVFDGTDWIEKTPATTPGPLYAHAMAYDTGLKKTLLFGGIDASQYSSRTWTWDGTNWQQLVFSTVPPARSSHAMTYDPKRGETVMFGGFISPNRLGDTWTFGSAGWVQKFPARDIGTSASHTLSYDPILEKIVFVNGQSVRLWDGTNWEVESGGELEFDMTERLDGVWNFTSINVPQGVTVKFRKNATNTPVTWLASESVVINGSLNLDGEDGRGRNIVSGNEAVGGPGGYKGGLGGAQYFNASTNTSSTAGGGPGGGDPVSGSTPGRNGVYAGAYGNSFVQPLIGGSGGSGGGGGSGSTNGNGGNGGAGGGAILIASSKDIVVSGTISADGGEGASATNVSNGSRDGGDGSGGAIRLVADRVQGSGTLSAKNGFGSPNGRIRIEGFERSLAMSTVQPPASAGPPTDTLPGLDGNNTLTIASVDGANVRQPPEGNTTNPDVIFAEEGEITIVVGGTNVPDGTPITLRVSTSGGLITLPADGDPPVTMAAGSATFSTMVPAGVGTIQAYATISPIPLNP
ncbi:Kelch repeat-containing protein [Haloferula sp.]|uniref:Kelch repeat-containing protein n=1 Tax=Haloferula sp. TaxID=2497595 RepID=UPI003C757E13